jgi:DNA-binding MarR family transcriptional regulator
VTAGTQEKELAALGIALDRIAAWTRRQAGGGAAGLSMTARSTLGMLRDEGPQRLSELARLEGISQPAMTTLVNRLEAEQLVRRDGDPADGRVVIVSITAAGRQSVESRRAERARALMDQVAQLPADQRAALIAALPALRVLSSR